MKVMQYTVQNTHTRLDVYITVAFCVSVRFVNLPRIGFPE